MRIYLSSTSVDLKPYRQAVLGVLRRMGHEAAAFLMSIAAFRL